MYETINRLQKIAHEYRLPELNTKIVQLKQITNWDRLNNSFLFNKNFWKKVNDDVKKSVKIYELNNLKRDFDNIMRNFSDDLKTMYKNISNNMNFFNANHRGTMKYCSEIISRYELNQNFIDSLKNMQESLNEIGELQLDKLFFEIKYTKEDLSNDIEELSVNLHNPLYCENDDSIDGKVQIENYFTNLRIKYPKLYILFVLFNTIFTFMGYVDMFSDFVPKIESSIVYLQGNSDIYYVKEDCAKIYEGASSQTKIMDYIFYSEEVMVLEDVKMWVKVLCKGQSGNLIIGWVAKRNLMSYEDYQFSSDKLYSID